jgi:hypothetical protein
VSGDSSSADATPNPGIDGDLALTAGNLILAPGLSTCIVDALMRLRGGGSSQPGGGDGSYPRFIRWLLWDGVTVGEN